MFLFIAAKHQQEAQRGDHTLLRKKNCDIMNNVEYDHNTGW